MTTNGGSPSPPRTGHSPTQVGGDYGRIGEGGVVSTEPSRIAVARNQSINRSRHIGGVGGGGGGTQLTRQQLYRSRNFLHHDLQLPDGYGEF